MLTRQPYRSVYPVAISRSSVCPCLTTYAQSDHEGFSRDQQPRWRTGPTTVSVGAWTALWSPRRSDIGLPSTIPGVEPQHVLEWARRAQARGFSCLGTIDRIVYDNYEPRGAAEVQAAGERQASPQREPPRAPSGRDRSVTGVRRHADPFPAHCHISIGPGESGRMAHISGGPPVHRGGVCAAEPATRCRAAAVRNRRRRPCRRGHGGCAHRSFRRCA